MKTQINTPTQVSPRRYRVGFWAVALAFLTVSAFTTVPTPIWSTYAQRDGLSSLMVTVVFAVYALGVAASLFLVGHVSDWHGRRRVLGPALLLNVIAAVVFLLWPELAGLFVARAISGFGIGAVNATATAWLFELHAADRGETGHRRAEVVAVAANLGGLGTGALISGLLVQWTGDSLTIPFLAFIAGLVVALALVLSAPETRPALKPRPSYRPQHVSVPASSRDRFLAAAVGAMVTFALFGLFTSLAPSFLAGSLHEHSKALAGAVAFALFATAALAQVLSSSRSTRELLMVAVPLIVLGLGLLTVAVWLAHPSLALFLAGAIVGGAGSGLMFKGAIATVSALSAPESRAEALAGLFLAAYLGLAGPVIGLGLLTQFVTARMSLLVFASLLALGLAAATPWLLGRGSDSAPRGGRSGGTVTLRRAGAVRAAVLTHRAVQR